MSQQSTNLIPMFFYGSLRKLEYNYDRFVEIFGEENFQYQETTTVDGYQLYSLGAYPAVVPTEGSTVVVDKFLVSPEAYNSVRAMELGAGYQETQIDGNYLYYFTEEDRNYLGPKVESGDWSKYLTEKEEVTFI